MFTPVFSSALPRVQLVLRSTWASRIILGSRSSGKSSKKPLPQRGEPSSHARIIRTNARTHARTHERTNARTHERTHARTDTYTQYIQYIHIHNTYTHTQRRKQVIESSSGLRLRLSEA